MESINQSMTYPYQLSASYGMLEYCTDHDTTPAQLLSMADHIMYMDKESHRKKQVFNQRLYPKTLLLLDWSDSPPAPEPPLPFHLANLKISFWRHMSKLTTINHNACMSNNISSN